MRMRLWENFVERKEGIYERWEKLRGRKFESARKYRCGDNMYFQKFVVSISEIWKHFRKYSVALTKI